MRGSRDRGIAVEQGAGVERREEPLVGIHDERVRPLDAPEPVPDGGSQERGAPVRPVDVQPDAALRAHVGHRIEVVHDPRVRRSGARHHREEAVDVGRSRAFRPAARPSDARARREGSGSRPRPSRRPPTRSRSARCPRTRSSSAPGDPHAGTPRGDGRPRVPTGSRPSRPTRSIHPRPREARRDRRATGASGSPPRRRRRPPSSSLRTSTKRSAPGRTGCSPSSARPGRTRGMPGDPWRSWPEPGRRPRCATPVRLRCPRR